MVDFMTGMTTAFALLAAIVAARRTGHGRDVDVSLYDVAMHQLSYPAVWYLNEGHVTDRIARSAHPYGTPSQLCQTADGWIFVMCMTQKFWEIFCNKLDHPALAQDPRFCGPEERLNNRAELTQVLDDLLVSGTTAEWIEILAGSIPCGPVYNLAQALDNPYFLQRGGVRHINHPDHPDLKAVASPIRMGDDIPAQPAPKLGADNRAILSSLGYDDEEISALEASGAI
jgi:crotonobetainyl-CoA:carnitine CoA-transferase CaiB-like acyl-CoA transferase